MNMPSYTASIAIAITLTLPATAQVTEIPDHLYLNQESEHRTTIYNMGYVERIGLIHGETRVAARQGYFDSLSIVKSSGLAYNYSVRDVDSITFTVPDSLMRAHIDYQDAYPSYFYPLYSDNFVSYAAWDSRANWQLANIHDPTVMRAKDGYYYMSQTDAGYGSPISGKGHFYVRRSQDLVNWEPASSYNNSCILPNETPSWFLDSLNSVRERRGLDAIPSDSLTSVGYWAPCLRQINDTLYRCYYCLVTTSNYIATGGQTFDGSWDEEEWIGLAETSDPATGKWVDKGGVICSASDKGKDEYTRSTSDYWNAYMRFEAIDPSLIITPEGEHWLAYGSYHCGLAAIQLDPATGKTLEPLGDPWDIGTGQSTTYGELIYQRSASSRWQSVEGPEVVYNAETGYYYLFMACDGLESSYNTRVLRSKSITGPYMGKDGTNGTVNGGEAYPYVTHPYKFDTENDIDGYVGISHCCVWDDGEGNWYFCCQARKPEGYMDLSSANALMMGHLRRIFWTSDGWPVVSPERFGGVEQAPISADDLAGTWEVITFSSPFGSQKESESLTVTRSSYGENRVVLRGAITASGIFDEETNLLQIRPTGDEDNYYVSVSRELDWEASPRQATIVFCGFPTTTSTIWGKRSQD